MITNCFYKFTCGHIAFSRSSRVSYIPNVRMYTCHQNDFFISKKRGRAVRALPKHGICNISTNQPAKHSTSGSPHVPLHGASKLIVCGRRFCLRLSVLTADFMEDTANVVKLYRRSSGRVNQRLTVKRYRKTTTSNQSSADNFFSLRNHQTIERCSSEKSASSCVSFRSRRTLSSSKERTVRPVFVSTTQLMLFVRLLFRSILFPPCAAVMRHILSMSVHQSRKLGMMCIPM